VITSAGTHTGGSKDHDTGVYSLAQAVRDLGLETADDLEVDFATSTLSSLADPFPMNLLTAQGNPPSQVSPALHRSQLRILYPSEAPMRVNPNCVGASGIFHAHQRGKGATDFWGQHVRESRSNRLGVLSHSKLIWVRGRRRESIENSWQQERPRCVAWIYVGSANATRGAWGVESGPGKKGKRSLGPLRVYNWECGVVMPVPDSVLEELPGSSLPPYSVFGSIMEVPLQLPGPRLPINKMV
jgi:hypothetical protein